WFYYDAWDGDHLTYDANGKPFYPDGRMREGRVGLATLRRDGYVSLRAQQTGTLTTKPFRLTSDRIYLNANARDGQVRVEILDEQERPVQGFSGAGCRPIQTDGVHQPVSWTG